MNPHISFIADFALAAFSDETTCRAAATIRPQTASTSRRSRWRSSADVDPYFKFDANIVFGADGVEVEEAYATTLALPGNLQVRAGQFLTRFGRINPTHPHALGLRRSAARDRQDARPRRQPRARRRGLVARAAALVRSSSSSPRRWPTGECCARSFYGDEDRGVQSPQDLETMIALKQFHALSRRLVARHRASPPRSARTRRTAAPRATSLGADLYLKYRPISRESATVVSLQAEAHHPPARDADGHARRHAASTRSSSGASRSAGRRARATTS